MYQGGLIRRQGDGAPILQPGIPLILAGKSDREISEDALNLLADSAIATDFGAVNQPASGAVALAVERCGSFYKATFTLTDAQIPVTDAAGSGSHGTLKLADLVEGAWASLGCRQNYTAYNPDGTGVPDDAVFEIGVGFAAISAAADGSLGATEDDIGGDVNQTLSGGTTTGTAVTGPAAAADGTTTPLDINLNWSGTGDTIDDDGTIDVTGTITALLAFLGDD